VLGKGLILSGLGIFCLFFILPTAVDAQTTYNVYVNDLPSWADYASGVMYDATKAWEDANPSLEFYETSTLGEADFRVQWVKEFGVEHVGYAFGNRFLEVGLGDSDCKGNWQPYSSAYVTKIMMHEIGHILGQGHSSDPDNIMYPVALNKEYGLVEEEITVTQRIGQFIAFCTYNDVTSFDFQVTSDDPEYGFDVYVVPSIESLNDWTEGKSFQYYTDTECFGIGYRDYSGTCEGVERGGGLFVIMGDTLTNPLTKLSVKIRETGSTSTPAKSTLTPLPTPTPTPTPIPTPTPAPIPTPELPTFTEFGNLQVDKDEFVLSYSSQLVKVYGEAFKINRGDRIELLFTFPDGTTNGNKIVPTKDGYFESFLNLDKDSPKGDYEILASAYGDIIGIVHFTVLDKEILDSSLANGDAEPEQTPEDSLPDLLQDSDGDGIIDSSDLCPLEPETINDYNDEDGCPDSKPFTNDWEQKSIKTKNMVITKLISLKPGINIAERSLYEAEFSSTAAQKELDFAWAKLGEAKKFLDDSELSQEKGESLSSELRYEAAFYKFQNSFDNAQKIDAHLLKITEHLEDAELLESAYTEGTQQKSNEKFCFLFWCW